MADMPGLAVWFRKTKTAMYQLCPIFRLTKSKVSVWIDYSLKVLCRVVKDEKKREFGIRRRTHTEMEKSASLLEKNRVHGPTMKGIFAMKEGVGCAVPIFGKQIYRKPM